MSLSATQVANDLYNHFKDEYSQPWSGVRYEMPVEGIDFGDYTAYEEDSYGGEGKGDSAWVVIRTRTTDGVTQFFRKDGYYASYEGYTWDGDFFEVNPTVKTVTYYEEAVAGNKFGAYQDYTSYDLDSFGD